MKKRRYLILTLIGAVCLAAGAYAGMRSGVLQIENGMESDGDRADLQENSASDSEEEEKLWSEAAHTPYGKYPETVTYTLGKISGSGNSGLPVGESYEENAYTRYLREMLNIQNVDVFELEDGSAYELAVEMAIEDNEIPDVLVIKGRDNLKKLVEKGLVEDLTESYESCTTERVKAMYESYGGELLASATFDGKLYAYPDTVIDHGMMLLWLRKDWIDALGLQEPQTLEEGMEIIRQFVAHDMAGGGSTIGLACSTELVSDSSSTYGMDPIFDAFHSSPGKWILGDQQTVEYSSVTEETKRAVAYLHELYESGVVDSRFLLRTTENLDKLVADGKCGALFGNWWAPNNPLIESARKDNKAEWIPYLLTCKNDSQNPVFESYKDWMYVVVRKGYAHPEIVGKYISVLFDYTRYEDTNAREINDYFSLNVDPTARPLNINVDYWDGLYRVTDHILEVMNGERRVQELTGIEKAYYNTCKSYLDGNLTTANAWAAYASRIQAVGLLSESGRGYHTLSMGDGDGEIPQHLQKLETETFLQIIVGEKPVEYFDVFVEKWYAEGGEELTQKVQEGYEQAQARK